ncbi:MAG: ABC transporter ATP-binding protein [Myxococcota bacterium]
MVGLVLENVGVKHRGGPEVVHNVTLQCPRGQVTGLLGPNGAGKSSLLKAIAGLLESSGVISVDGRLLRELSPRDRARTVGYVPQRTRLDALLSVRDVVDQGRFAHRGPLAGPSRKDREVAERALKEVNALHLADRPFPELSGGEQQKVMIARALATGATTLLLDEPTAALDARHVLVLHQVLRRLAEQNYCVLVVLHGLDEAHRHADRAVLLAEGKVHATGPAKEIIAADPVREVYGVELRAQAGLSLFLPEDTP